MDESNTQERTNAIDEQFQHIKGVIESLLFVNERPVTIDQFKKILETVSAGDIKKAIGSLQDEYEDRKSGMMIVEIAGGYQMLSNPAYATYLRNFYKTKHKEKLSKPSLESMAIIAYKQPVTRSDIELIRGVNSDGVVANLLDKELIKVVGRKDVPGRPFLYGTTKQFLEYFGLKSLDDLPTLEEFPTLQPAAEINMLPIEDEEPDEGDVTEEEMATDIGIEAADETETAQEEVLTEAQQAEIQENGNKDEGKLTEEIINETEQQDYQNEPEEFTRKN